MRQKARVHDCVGAINSPPVLAKDNMICDDWHCRLEAEPFPLQKVLLPNLVRCRRKKWVFAPRQCLFLMVVFTVTLVWPVRLRFVAWRSVSAGCFAI